MTLRLFINRPMSLILRLLCYALTASAGLSARVLLGVEVHGGQDEALVQSQLSNALLLAATAKAELGIQGHELDVFVCFAFGVTSRVVDPAMSVLNGMKIPIYFSSSPDKSVCTLEYPESALSRYSVLIHMRGDISHKQLSLSEYTDWMGDVFFAIPRSSLIEANAVHRSIATDKRTGRVSRKRGILSQILIEHSRGFSVLQHLNAQLPDAPDAFPPPEHAIFPMFTPASVAVKHESSICQLWWPLNGVEYLHLPSTGPLHEEEFPIIIACDVPDATEAFTIRVSTYPEHPTESAPSTVASVAMDATSDFYGSYKPTCIVSYSAFLPPGYVNLTVELDSKFRGIVSKFHIRLNSLSLDSVPFNSHRISPSLLKIGVREYLGLFLNSLGLTGTYVEVGVHRGEFAEKMLMMWNGNRYIGVDPWEEKFVQDYIDGVNEVDKDRLSDMNAFFAHVSTHKARVTALRMYSTEAAARFVDETIDAVFIDAMHHYHMVMQDMQAWWPKIKSGGIMMGHDYQLMVHSKAVFTVKPAVLEFGRKLNLPVLHTPTLDSCWYIVKPS